ncbi:Glycine receptor subunit alpha-3 [Homalodisca vitripennis]|nr:Glycine receptor subunit alpha-3 [Homalodisca vitripennis]
MVTIVDTLSKAIYHAQLPLWCMETQLFVMHCQLDDWSISGQRERFNPSMSLFQASGVRAKKPSLILNLGTNGLKVVNKLIVGMTPTTLILSLVVFWSKICWSSQETANLQQEQTRILNQLLEKYDHRIIPYNNNRTDGFDYVDITVNWLLLHISGISDYDMDFSMQIMFNLEWVDGRLKYEDNGIIEYLTLTDTSKVWVPDVFFANEKDGHQHRLAAPNIFYRIYPSGKVVYSTR